MDRSIISVRYARSLLNFASKRAKEEQVYQDSVALAESFSRYPMLGRVLSNILLSQEKKIDIIIKACEKEISPEFSKFIQLVVEQRREDLLYPMCLSYQRLMFDYKNLMSVKLITAIPIDEQMQAKIKTKIQDLIGKTVILKLVVDRSIIGGYIAYWDTYRYDTSVKTTLRRIEKSLTI